MSTINQSDPVQGYYGRYSNAARGKRRKKEAVKKLHPTRPDQPTEPDLPAECFSRERRRNWAHLPRKIYEVDPLTCDQCGSHFFAVRTSTNAKYEIRFQGLNLLV